MSRTLFSFRLRTMLYFKFEAFTSLNGLPKRHLYSISEVKLIGGVRLKTPLWQTKMIDLYRLRVEVATIVSSSGNSRASKKTTA